jgi:hypothetical protein
MYSPGASVKVKLELSTVMVDSTALPLATLIVIPPMFKTVSVVNVTLGSACAKTGRRKLAAESIAMIFFMMDIFGY